MVRYLCGGDIGGTKLAAGLVDPDGRVRQVRSTGEHTCVDEACAMDLIAELVKEACRDEGLAVHDLEGVGVGMAGHMRSKDGVVLTTSNLKGYKNYPVSAELGKRLGIKVALENDANCQAWAEHRFGAGRGFTDMIFVTVSTGIGAGIIINNRLLRGMTGTAGEIGHTIVDPNSDLSCSCGNHGCFMALASTINLEALALKKSQRMKTRLFSGSGAEETRAAVGDSCRIDGKQVYAHAQNGDPVAVEIIDEYAGYLGIMLYNIFQIFNPPVIVLGGGLMNWQLGYFEKIQAKFNSLAKDMLYDPIRIVRAEIGVESGVIGAATLLLEE